MTEAIAASPVKLHDLKSKFGLERIEDDSFFSEWLESLPDLTESDRTILTDSLGTPKELDFNNHKYSLVNLISLTLKLL